jgi:acyl carrier protein
VALRSWVASKSGRPAGEQLDGAGLFQDGLLNSLDLIELIMLIERLSGNPVDVDSLTAEDVSTIDAIAGRFFDEVRAT